MLSQIFIVAFGLIISHAADAAIGKSYTNWDCCKPGCAWASSLSKDVSGAAKVCDAKDKVVSNGKTISTGCSSGGKGFLCSDYSPMPTSDDLSYGFAVMAGTSSCCKCYQLQWTSGNAAGKSMIVQAINTFTGSGSISTNDIVIITPGGGFGPNNNGCKSQFGSTFGQALGNVNQASDCDSLPDNLQGGCYWRYNWARGGINGWDISYDQVDCPSRLTDISGCAF